MVAVGKVSVFVYELIPEPAMDTTPERGAPEPQEPIESTMLMPAWQAEAMNAREIIQASPVSPVVQLSPGRSFHQKYAACLRAGDSEGCAEPVSSRCDLAEYRCMRGGNGSYCEVLRAVLRRPGKL